MKERVVILGGGVAGLAAAYELSRTPELRERYVVKLYQMGWRLGGKAASSRDEHDRILEHGLHFFGAYYENAFSMLDDVYREMRRLHPKHPPLSEAFTPHTRITWPITRGDSPEVRLLSVDVPASDHTLPGKRGATVPDPASMVTSIFTSWGPALVRSVFQSVGTESAVPGRLDGELYELVNDTAVLGALGLELTNESPVLPTLSWSIEKIVERSVEAFKAALAEVAEEGWRAVVPVLEHLRSAAVLLDDKWPRWSTRVFRVLVSMVTTQIIGMIRGGVLDPNPEEGVVGFDRLNGVEFTKWLSDNGADPVLLNSRMMTSTYDYLFAFHEGAYAIDAGVMCRMVLRFMLQNPDKPIQWRMATGMGECVVSPLYEVLRARGVEFEFFHRVDSLALSDDGLRVTSVAMTRQVQVEGYRPTYQPGPRDWVRWYEHPDATQLPEETARSLMEEFAKSRRDLEDPSYDPPGCSKLELRVSKDFDRVVLGLSVDAARQVTNGFKEETWRTAMQSVKTTDIAAAQMWLDRPCADLGTTASSRLAHDQTIMVGAHPPFVAWADMFHTLKHERTEQKHAGCVYLCGPLPRPAGGYAQPSDAYAGVETSLTNWINERPPAMWPAFHMTNVARADGAPPVHAEHIYYRANIHPSDRYVLSVPGSTAARMTSSSHGIENLHLVGDWVRTGLDFGCAEAAVMSAMQARRDITGDMEPVSGEADYPGHRPTGAGPQRELPDSSTEARREHYIGPELVLKPPYGFSGVRFDGIVVEGHSEAIERSVRELNLRGFDFEPMLRSHVILVMMHYQRGWMGDAQDKAFRYSEMSMAIPVYAEGVGALWYLPYLYTDDMFALVNGRERYGFAKSPSILRGFGPKPLPSIAVEVPVLCANPDVYANRWRTLLRVDGLNQGGPIKLPEGLTFRPNDDLRAMLFFRNSNLSESSVVDAKIRPLQGFLTRRRVLAGEGGDADALELLEVPVGGVEIDAKSLKVCEAPEVHVQQVNGHPLVRDILNDDRPGPHRLNAKFQYSLEFKFQLLAPRRLHPKAAT